ncbi:NF-X1 finger and helicase domain protein, putative [Babesia caballi]|uniref:NF-X1 finger and helicase domain protein, putative n=1 Tax=Babesia caballi TaxID=5871 RepID=A0AAV4LUF4_BABCB|nr:NF-X1 finger and helicase domain protein, putative [Babesia caballi]
MKRAFAEDVPSGPNPLLAWVTDPSSPTRPGMVFALAAFYLALYIFAVVFILIHKDVACNACVNKCNRGECSSAGVGSGSACTSCQKPKEPCERTCQKCCVNNCAHKCTGAPDTVRTLFSISVLVLLFVLAAIFALYVRSRVSRVPKLVVEIPETASNLVGSAATIATPVVEGQ